MMTGRYKNIFSPPEKIVKRLRKIGNVNVKAKDVAIQKTMVTS